MKQRMSNGSGIYWTDRGVTLVLPFGVNARVIDVHVSNGHGEPESLTLEDLYDLHADIDNAIIHMEST